MVNKILQDGEHTYAKPEKVQRKPIPKKNKPQAIPAAVPIDYRDNYEGDCDDDDYDKEKQENPNRWKTNVNRSGTKHHHHHQTRNPETASYKSPRPNKNPPRKDKNSQKRRSTEKVNVKCELIENASEDSQRLCDANPRYNLHFNRKTI